MPPQNFTTQLTVISSEIRKQGTGKNGKPYTLSLLTCTDRNGQPIENDVKTFETFTPGPHTVEVEVQHHEQYGTSYMVKKAGGGGQQPQGVPAQQPADPQLVARVAALEAWARTQGFQGALQPGGSAIDPQGPPQGWQGAQSAGATFGGAPADDDIPF